MGVFGLDEGWAEAALLKHTSTNKNNP